MTIMIQRPLFRGHFSCLFCEKVSASDIKRCPLDGGIK